MAIIACSGNRSYEKRLALCESVLEKLKKTHSFKSYKGPEVKGPAFLVERHPSPRLTARLVELYEGFKRESVREPPTDETEGSKLLAAISASYLLDTKTITLREAEETARRAMGFRNDLLSSSTRETVQRLLGSAFESHFSFEINVKILLTLQLARIYMFQGDIERAKAALSEIGSQANGSIFLRAIRDDLAVMETLKKQGHLPTSKRNTNTKDSK